MHEKVHKTKVDKKYCHKSTVISILFERVLIDTLWNVKYDIVIVQVPDLFVLIDTLWNVKTEPLAVEGSTVTVLIDTLWNVK